MAIRSARAPSPAFSETEVDISSKLFGDDAVSSDEDVNPNALPLGTSQQARKKARREDAGAAGLSEEDEDDAFISMLQSTANRSKHDTKGGKKAGAFQTMGLNVNLLKAISRKGFNVPTPIQRKTIPLILDGQDVVGMARTGSGKTAAFVIPMIEKLKAHSAKVGARAVVLSPSRELALQTLKVVKEMGKGTDLRTTLLVGGDSLEEQFSSMASNPDIIIATPGRFEHLKVEMRLELSSVKYIVFDEADRLFEMGFAAQLMEIMHSLPPSRQTLLFSATLPKSLVEFARAGLQDPRLVRLDAESKIAPGLESAFFNVKRAEKEGALLHILQDVIKMPTGRTKADVDAQNEKPGKKRKRNLDDTAGRFGPSPHSTVVFAATKHHVEYLAGFLKAVGYATSYVYGALDQTARKMQVQDFRTGMTNILVVTDVAARGLDIPILANVINYDFPSQPKIFIHRVGRTARAGKQGWSYSFVTGTDMPYLLDLQLFLGRKLVVGQAGREEGIFQNGIVLGAMARSALERYTEEAAKLVDEDIDLSSMRDVAAKGEKQYIRSRNAASAESVKRAKALVKTEDLAALNLIFEPEDGVNVEQARLDMLARVSGFRPQETIFEIGRRGVTSEAAEVMKKRRAQLEAKQLKQQSLDEAAEDNADEDGPTLADTNFAAGDDADDDSDEDELVLTAPGADMDAASDDELELTFSAPGDLGRSSGKQKWQDSEHFMSYTPTTLNMAEDRGYGVHSGGTGSMGSHFVTEARGATMDLTNDDADKRQGGGGLRWDKKQKKYVARANDEDGSKGAKMIRGESGLKIAASLRSGRFDAWKKANRVERLPKVGEMERAGAAGRFGSEGKRYKHKQEKAPKEADKYRDDYEVRKKKVAEAKEKRIGRFRDGAGKSEIRGVDDVRKERRLTQNRREKNARPARRK